MDSNLKRVSIALSLIILLGVLLMLMPKKTHEKDQADRFDHPFPDLKDLSVSILEVENGESLDAGVEGSLQIDYLDNKEIYNVILKTRGSSSRLMPKKQYSLKLLDENNEGVEEKIMDMPAGEDWVLNGPYIDKSGIRNYLAYKTAFQIMGYAPRLQYTELYLKTSDMEEAEYMGLFMYIEKIRRGKHRLQLSQNQENSKETSYIVAKDRYKSNDILMKVYGKEIFTYGKEMLHIYPGGSLTEEQKTFISRDFSQFERNLYSDKFNVRGQGYDQFINIESFIDYYLINEFFFNEDAGSYSTYFHKDIKGLLNIGPVWDFNESMGNQRQRADLWVYQGFFLHEKPWFERLLDDHEFVKKVIKRYRHLRLSALKTENLLSEIDQAMLILEPAFKRNHELWNFDDMNRKAFRVRDDQGIFQHYEKPANSRETYLPDASKDHREEIKNLKAFIQNRGHWLDENIESLLKWTE